MFLMMVPLGVSIMDSFMDFLVSFSSNVSSSNIEYLSHERFLTFELWFAENILSMFLRLAFASKPGGL